MPWDGKENRKLMNQDQIDRDRLLTEVHANVKQIVVWAEKHDKLDTERFSEVKKQIGWMQKVLFMGLGAWTFFITLLKFGGK